jgi:hypothetical protein
MLDVGSSYRDARHALRTICPQRRPCDAVGDDCRLVLADGSTLPNVYGIGLGTGFRPSLAMGCEPNFSGQANSLWLYQNDIGATVWRGIHED